MGKRGMPRLLLPMCLNVILVPFFGGFLLCASVKPDPILNSCPVPSSITKIFPIIAEHRPEPCSHPYTIASDWSNFLTFKSLSDLLPSYLLYGSLSMTPSPSAPVILSISWSRCSRLLHLVCSKTTKNGVFALSTSAFILSKRFMNGAFINGASKIWKVIGSQSSLPPCYLLTIETIF